MLADGGGSTPEEQAEPPVDPTAVRLGRADGPRVRKPEQSGYTKKNVYSEDGSTLVASHLDYKDLFDRNWSDLYSEPAVLAEVGKGIVGVAGAPDASEFVGEQPKQFVASSIVYNTGYQAKTSFVWHQTAHGRVEPGWFSINSKTGESLGSNVPIVHAPGESGWLNSTFYGEEASIGKVRFHTQVNHMSTPDAFLALDVGYEMGSSSLWFGIGGFDAFGDGIAPRVLVGLLSNGRVVLDRRKVGTPGEIDRKVLAKAGSAPTKGAISLRWEATYKPNPDKTSNLLTVLDKATLVIVIDRLDVYREDIDPADADLTNAPHDLFSVAYAGWQIIATGKKGSGTALTWLAVRERTSYVPGADPETPTDPEITTRRPNLRHGARGYLRHCGPGAGDGSASNARLCGPGGFR